MEIKEHKERLSALQTGRSLLNAHLQEIVDYLLPGTQGFTTTYQEGEKRLGRIYDPTGVHALNIFANGMSGLFTNSATSWFGIGAESPEIKEDAEVKTYLAQVERMFYAAFAKSNFYAEMRKYYRDYGATGTPIMYSEAHPRTMVNFQTLHLAENYIAVDQYGNPDTNYRLFEMTAKTIAEKWKDVGTKVSASLEKNKPDEKYQICQAVYPRKNRQYWSKNGLNKAWASIYFVVKDEHELNESGYNEFPFAIARSDLMTGEIYGRSLAMTALPFVKELNQVRRDKLIASELANDPAIAVAKNAFINPLSRWPGAVNIVNTMQPGAAVAEMPRGNPVYAKEEVTALQGEVRQIFFNDLMSLIEAPNQTATEVLERAQEKMRNMGGVVGPLQSGGLNPLFDRVFQILLEGGYLPPPPRSLQGHNLKIDYISPLAKAQKAYDLDAIRKGLAGVSAIAQIRPDIWDRVNLEEVAQYILENSGMQAKFINSDEVVEALRSARAQAQQAQEQAAMAAEAMKAVPQLGKGIEAESPLALLMNSSEGQGPIAGMQ